LAKLEQGLKPTIRQMRCMSLASFGFTTSDSKKNVEVWTAVLNFQLRPKIQAEKAGTIIVISGPFSRLFLETGLV
jgi:hypothetical protein